MQWPNHHLEKCAPSAGSSELTSAGVSKIPFLAGLGGVAWLCLVVFGLTLMFRYQTAPGLSADPPATWPKESSLQSLAGQARLVMTVHPQCPCTRASIGELALLMAACEGRLQTDVLFYEPKGVARNWTETDLWLNAARIPGVRVFRDKDGQEARRFHASTSGQTMLYDREGHLQFSGGITAGRGHSGENAGRAAIVDLLTIGKAAQRQTHVYGCALQNSGFNSPGEKICCKK